jgi:misacylated tRNA(Ala) deacylase
VLLCDLRRAAWRQRCAPHAAGEFPLATAVYNDQLKTEIAHVPADSISERPSVGDNVTLKLDWGPRYRRMRMHTALHLLSAVLPYPVTGGAGERGRQPA